MPLPLRKLVPEIGVLCEQLGFGDEHARPHKELSKTIHSFRREYHVPGGAEGKNLTDWEYLVHQRQLRSMAEAYLDAKGYGVRFWHPNIVSSHRKVPQYPMDKQM